MKIPLQKILPLAVIEPWAPACQANKLPTTLIMHIENACWKWSGLVTWQ